MPAGDAIIASDPQVSGLAGMERSEIGGSETGNIVYAEHLKPDTVEARQTATRSYPDIAVAILRNSGNRVVGQSLLCLPIRGDVLHRGRLGVCRRNENADRQYPQERKESDVMHSNLQCVTCFCLRSHRRPLPPLTPPGTPPRQQVALQGCVWSQEVILDSRARYRNEPKPGICQTPKDQEPLIIPAPPTANRGSPLKQERLQICVANRTLLPRFGTRRVTVLLRFAETLSGPFVR